MSVRFLYATVCMLAMSAGLALSACDTDPNVMYDLKEELKGTPDQMGSYHHPWDKDWQSPPAGASTTSMPSTNP